MTENEISKIVFECALKIHKALGPGLLESSYEACLCYELRENGLKVEQQKKLPIIYNKIKLDTGYVIDLIIEDKFIIELKSVKELNDIHMAQVLTYLKLSNCKLGFLINFNVKYLKNGVKRIINEKL